jgi:membrane protein required for colicin V production
MSYFDIVVGVVILLLGLKGILNGFFRELFGLVGIVGGVFIASRFGTPVGETLSDIIFHFENKAALNFTGFVLTLGVFWIMMVGVGFLFKKLSRVSGLGSIDKLMGFIVGAGKFFLIAAVVAYAFFNIKIVKTNMQATMDKSFLFPILVSTGAYIMKMDTTEIQNDVNATVEDKQTQMQNKIETTVKEKVQHSITEDIKKRVN